MPWVLPAIMGAQAIMGANQARAQRKAQQAENMAAAAQTEFSPWTGMGAGQINTAPTQSGLEGALSGGLKGYMQGKSIEAAGADSASVEKPKVDGYETAAKDGLQFKSENLGAMGAAPEMMAGTGMEMEKSSAWNGMGQDPNQLPTLAGMRPRR